MMKNNFVWTLIGVVVLTVVISFLFAYFLSWGWIVSLIIALSGGFMIRRLMTNKLDKINNEAS